MAGKMGESGVGYAEKPAGASLLSSATVAYLHKPIVSDPFRENNEIAPQLSVVSGIVGR